MSKRAEQRGLEALPPRWRKTKDGKGKVDSALPVRKFYIRAYEQAEKDTIAKIRKQVEMWMPDDPEGDEYISGERVAFRSVLHLLKAMEEE